MYTCYEISSVLCFHSRHQWCRAFSWSLIDVDQPNPLWMVSPLGRWFWAVFEVKLSKLWGVNSTPVPALTSLNNRLTWELKAKRNISSTSFFLSWCFIAAMTILTNTACVYYVYHLDSWCPQRPDDGIRSLGTIVTDDYRPPCGCWKLNPGPLQEP